MSNYKQNEQLGSVDEIIAKLKELSASDPDLLNCVIAKGFSEDFSEQILKINPAFEKQELLRAVEQMTTDVKYQLSDDYLDKVAGGGQPDVKFISKHDDKNSDVVIFQKQAFPNYDMSTIAWKVIKNCGRG